MIIMVVAVLIGRSSDDATSLSDCGVIGSN